MKSTLIHSRIKLLLSACCIGIVVSSAVFFSSQFGLFTKLENIYFDALSRARRTTYTAATSEILIVSIDQTSLAELGSWPWNRKTHAQLIKKLADCGAEVIGVDIIFSDEGIDADADKALVDEVRDAGRVVMPVHYEEARIGTQLENEYYYPFQALVDARVGLGTINVRPDTDGVLRRIRLLPESSDGPAWPYAVEIVRRYKGIPLDKIYRSAGAGLFCVGSIGVPLVDNKNMFIRFRGPGKSFPYLSYATVLRGGYDRGLFHGKIVLVGATAQGLRTDHFHTPFTTYLPGVEVQANIIDTFLKEDFIRDLPKVAWVSLVCILSILSAAAFLLLGWKMAMCVFIGGIFLIVHGSAWFFHAHAMYTYPVPLISSLTLCFISSIVYKDIYAERSVNVQHLDLRSLYQVGKETMRIVHPQQVMHFILDMLRTLMRIDAATVVMMDTATQNFTVGAVRGAEWFTEKIEPGMPFVFRKKVMEYLRNRKEALILGSSGQRLRLLGDTGEVNPRMRSRVYVPLISDDQVIGVLAVYKKQKHAFDEYAVQTLFVIASQVAIAIKNYELYDDLQRSFKDTVKGLVSAVDAKDPYTRGHSERVAQYSVAIGLALGFGPARVEALEYAALLHDVGKIGIDLIILRKQRELSEKELDVVRHHAAAGAKILEPIRFLAKSLPGIRHHHERYDGAGYPAGLAGDAIPEDARIIGVADAFDAMTTNRAYSAAKPAGSALAILKQNSGAQFDPRIVDVFITVFNEKFAAQFQAQQSLIQPQEKYEDLS